MGRVPVLLQAVRVPNSVNAMLDARDRDFPIKLWMDLTAFLEEAETASAACPRALG